MSSFPYIHPRTHKYHYQIIIQMWFPYLVTYMRRRVRLGKPPSLFPSYRCLLNIICFLWYALCFPYLITATLHRTDQTCSQQRSPCTPIHLAPCFHSLALTIAPREVRSILRYCPGIVPAPFRVAILTRGQYVRIVNAINKKLACCVLLVYLAQPRQQVFVQLSLAFCVDIH